MSNGGNVVYLCERYRVSENEMLAIMACLVLSMHAICNAVKTNAEVCSGSVPYFGFADSTGKVFKQIDMSFYCNHYHANNDNTLYVGDAVENLLLIRLEAVEANKLTILARHNTTWKYHWAHCYPTFSWQGDKILYAASTDDDHGNLFLIEDIR